MTFCVRHEIHRSTHRWLRRAPSLPVKVAVGLALGALAVLGLALAVGNGSTLHLGGVHVFPFVSGDK